MNLLSRMRTRREIRNALMKLPSEIYATYDQTLARIAEQGEADELLAKRAFSWVMRYTWSLNIDQLRLALSVSPGDSEVDSSAMIDEETLMSICCDLLTVEKDSGMVTLIHHTTRTYFESTRHFYLIHADQEIAQACLAILLSIPNGRTRWLDEIGKQADILVSYAANTWGFHVEKAELQDSMVDLIVAFLNNESLVSSVMKYMLVAFQPTFHGGIRRVHRFRVSQENTNGFNGLHLVAHFSLPLLGAKEISMKCSTETLNHAATDSGWTRPMFAPKYSQREVAELLINDCRTRINEVNHGELDTALHLAAYLFADDIHLVNLLIHKGANVAALTNQLCMLLHDAAEAGHPEVVQVLIEAGGNVAARTSTGTPPLYRAVRGGNMKAFQYIYQKDQNVNNATWDLWTPLHEAAESDNAEMANLLIAYGADTTKRNLMGINALDLAEMLGHSDVV